MSEDDIAFRKLVRAMREAQRAYFKTRSPDWLNESKKLERLVDEELKDQNKLFDN